MVRMAGWRAPHSLMPILGALAASMLLVLVAISSSRTGKVVLIGLDMGGEVLRGPMPMPEHFSGGLPHPYSKDHPLGLVQV